MQAVIDKIDLVTTNIFSHKKGRSMQKVVHSAGRLAVIILLLGTMHLQADRIVLKNFSNRTLWVFLEKVTTIGQPHNNFSGTIAPGGTLDKSDTQILQVWVLPFTSQADFLASYINNANRKRAAEQLDLTQKLGRTDSRMAFDIDQNSKPFLYYGQFAINKSFTVLEASDIHVDDEKANDNDLRMLCNQMNNSISNSNKKVKGVVFAGDLGSYGKQTSLNKFLAFFYNPLNTALQAINSNIFLGLGNHDCHWEGFSGVSATAQFIADTYGGFIYKFKIGQVQFINLGLYPSATREQYNADNLATLTTSVPAFDFLTDTLAQLDKTQPIVLIHHYPPNGNFSRSWSATQQNQYFDLIKDYNIVAIIVGHIHTARLYKFKDSILVIQCANGKTFAELVFDPLQPAKVGVTYVKKTGERYVPPVE